VVTASRYRLPLHSSWPLSRIHSHRFFRKKDNISVHSSRGSAAYCTMYSCDCARLLKSQLHHPFLALPPVKLRAKRDLLPKCLTIRGSRFQGILSPLYWLQLVHLGEIERKKKKKN